MNPRAEILSEPSPAARICLPPRLDRQQRASSLGATEPGSQCIEREPYRDFRKLVDWPKADHAAARAIGLDVRVALGCELLEGGVRGSTQPYFFLFFPSLHSGAAALAAFASSAVA